MGDLLTANLYRISPGDTEVEVEDWDTGKPVKLALDPLMAPNKARGMRLLTRMV